MADGEASYWKGRSRYWERIAKEYWPAARDSARLVEAERRAAEAEARLVRLEVALEHGLSVEDLPALDGVSDRAALHGIAAGLVAERERRLAARNRPPRVSHG